MYKLEEIFSCQNEPWKHEAGLHNIWKFDSNHQENTRIFITKDYVTADL
jgi:hypothetical protein